MKYLELNNGFFAKVDDDDFEKFSTYSWTAVKRKSGGYNITRHFRAKGKSTVVLLPRLIMNCPDGLVVDHVNHDTLDNRKCNLRICSVANNNMNQRKIIKRTSRYKGVSLRKEKRGLKKWRACINLDKKRISLGDYSSEEEAAFAYNKAAKRYFGEFAYLNHIHA